MRKKRQDTEGGGFTPPATRPRLTPIDIQQKEFRLAFRGYNERDVDEFLDRVTEALSAYVEESRGLEEPGAGPVRPGGDPAWASREAEEILARARAEADAILREAEARAAALGAGAAAGDPRAVIAPYLNRERDFLQGLGALVQEHAEAVRGMAKAAKEQAEAARRAAPPQEAQVIRIPAEPDEPGAEPAQTPGGEVADQATDQVGSVRELFWGED